MRAAILAHFHTNHWLQVAHILEDLPVAIVDAVLTVKAMLEDLALRVQLVDNRVGVAALVVREDGHLAKLGDLEQEFAQVRPLVYVDAAGPVLFILRVKMTREDYS